MRLAVRFWGVLGRLGKARKSSKLVPRKVTAVRDGKSYLTTVWVNPEDEKKASKPAAAQFDLFAEADAIEELQAKQPKKAEPETDDKKIAAAIASATPENRSDVQTALFGNDPELAKPEPYIFNPINRSTSDVAEFFEGLSFWKAAEDYPGRITDYREVPPDKIMLVNAKKILDEPRPQWIPDIHMRNFERKGWWLNIKRVDDDNCVVFHKDYREERSEARPYPVIHEEPMKASIMSFDNLVATIDYYTKLKSAKYNLEMDEKDAAAQQHSQKILDQFLRENSMKAIESDRVLQRRLERYQRALKSKYKRERFPILGRNKMTLVQDEILTSEVPDDSEDKSNWFKYGQLRDRLDQKMQDMEIQRLDWESSFAKGRETSYGPSNQADTLLDSHGVYCKRQNGDQIAPEEIEQIRTTLDDVYQTFGDKSQMARSFGLRISHAGKVLQHARSAIGLYFPAYKAIGVTAKLGNDQFGFTMAHEWAHFMDNYIGQKQRRHNASDHYDSLAGTIASTFRSNMMKAQKSAYQNRTCECFARAFEQYFAEKQGKGDQYQTEVNKAGNHPSRKVFVSQVMPLIEQWLKDNDQLLKSMRREARFFGL